MTQAMEMLKRHLWRVTCEKYIGNRPRVEVIITEE